MQGERGISRRDFLYGALAGGLLVGGGVDVYHNVGKRAKMIREAKGELNLPESTPASHEGLTNKIDEKVERGEGPSEKRMWVGGGTAIAGDGMIIWKLLRSPQTVNSPATNEISEASQAPVQNEVPHEEKA